MSDFFLFTGSETALAVVVGGLLFFSGAFLILVVVRQYFDEAATQPPESFLAPVLAIDTLEPDLRVLWVKSMLLEAESAEIDRDVAHRLAREIRRGVIVAQSERVRGARSIELVGVLSETIQDSLTTLRSGGRPPFESHRETLAQTRTALDENIEGR